MQLVMRRHRTEGFDLPVIGGILYAFKIHAKLECNGEEHTLISKYDLRNVIITPGNVRRDLRNSAMIAAVIAFLVYAIFFRFINFVSVLVFFIAWFIVYHQLREAVRVNDLMDGRFFKARSLVQLLVKEQRIRKMCGVFAIVLEQAETWHEPEVVQVVPKPLGIMLETTDENSGYTQGILTREA